MKTTLRDVASHLNLSPALVSQVLNDKPGVWASEDTRRRVFEAVEALDYRPSASARALATGKSMQFALLVELSEAMGSSITRQPDVRGLLDAAARHGYRVLLLPLHAGEDAERQLERLATDKLCDGVCLFSPQLVTRHIEILGRHKMPCVLIGDLGEDQRNDQISALAARVDHDNFRYAFDSVLWLHAQGHSSIAWATAPGEANHPHNLELRRGYTEALAQIGAKTRILPHFDRPGGIEACLQNRDFSAVIVRYLHGAMAWLHHAAVQNVRLPQDLTILGHLDTSEISTLVLAGFQNKIAFHCHDARRAGERAGEILVRWAAGDAPDEQLSVIAPHAPGWGADVSKQLVQRS